MLDMTGACQRTDEAAPYFEQMMDWTIVEETGIRSKYSEIMFQNFANSMEEARIDITNPIEMMVVLKKMDPTKFRQLFHPSVVQDTGRIVWNRCFLQHSGPFRRICLRNY